LRERKHRPVKPFAVMFADIPSIEAVAVVSKEEQSALESVASPIVLLETKNNICNEVIARAVTAGFSKIGAMVPYTPLFDLIVSQFGRPLIATSANISDAPVIFKDDEALESLFDVADYVLVNNREIVVPQDDSVIQFAKMSKQKIIFRRSRGLAPSYFDYACNTGKTVLATGASLKSTFTLVHNRNVYISQYLGDTGSFEAQKSYAETVQHFFDLFHLEPELVLTDKHPLYYSNEFARDLSSRLNIQFIQLQHHKAHFASVLAENNLIQQTGRPVLGVIWDGTGLGDDGNIWGGEFFSFENNQIERCAHFDYFPFILGDKMPANPRISAIAICRGLPGADDLLKSKFTAAEWQLYGQILDKSSLKCSSMGSIFDAVASLLNICNRQSFEGEAAMLLQDRAMDYLNRNDWIIQEHYFIECLPVISTFSIMKQIIEDIQLNKPVEFIAAKFHHTLVLIVKGVAKSLGLKRIAFSGGVFLNSVLVDLLHLKLAKDFELFFHQELSPNDENISFGQFVMYDHQMNDFGESSESKERINRKNKEVLHDQFQD
jgi:hydrogenase maturation protein HypF